MALASQQDRPWMPIAGVIVAVACGVGWLTSPSTARASGFTQHALMARLAARDSVHQDLHDFLTTYMQEYMSGVMAPDQASEYYKTLSGWSNHADNLSHGNQQGHDGVNTSLLNVLLDSCPAGITGDLECNRAFAFFMGMLAHDIGDALPHATFQDQIEEHCGFSDDAAHNFHDAYVDVCLARVLHGQTGPVLLDARAAEVKGDTCSYISGSAFSFGVRCWTCPSGYSRILNPPEPWASMGIPICTKTTTGAAHVGGHPCLGVANPCNALQCLSCPPKTNATATLTPIGACPLFQCTYTHFAVASDAGGLCPTGQFYDLVTDACYGCPSNYEHNELVPALLPGACGKWAECGRIDPAEVGVPIPPIPIVHPPNIYAPLVVFEKGYDDFQLALERDLNFQTRPEDDFDLQGLKDEAWSSLGTFHIEHMDQGPVLMSTLSGLAPQQGCSPTDGDCDAGDCTWAFDNAFTAGAGSLRDSAKEIRRFLDALWTNRDILGLKTKRKDGFTFMLVADAGWPSAVQVCVGAQSKCGYEVRESLPELDLPPGSSADGTSTLKVGSAAPFANAFTATGYGPGGVVVSGCGSASVNGAPPTPGCTDGALRVSARVTTADGDCADAVENLAASVDDEVKFCVTVTNLNAAKVLYVSVTGDGGVPETPDPVDVALDGLKPRGGVGIASGSTEYNTTGEGFFFPIVPFTETISLFGTAVLEAIPGEHSVRVGWRGRFVNGEWGSWGSVDCGATLRVDRDVVCQPVFADTTTTTAGAGAPSQSEYGENIVLSAHVAKSDPQHPWPPLGTMTFSTGGTVLGTSQVGPEGTATLAVSDLEPGVYPIVASYSGSEWFEGSSSTLWSQTVNKAETTTSVDIVPNPAATRKPLLFVATVATNFATVPTGEVTFFLSGVEIGSVPLTDGVARLRTSLQAPGAYSVTATYSGDVFYLPSEASTGFAAALEVSTLGAAAAAGFVAVLGLLGLLFLRRRL